MIPKVIHYCWFGRNPLPPLAKKCIASWKKYLPDYEIKEWNEDNFDVNMLPYTKEAYEAKKYAFVSDFARFWILYNYGGIYFDTDVEVIKNMDHIIARGNFMGCEFDGSYENRIRVAPGLGLGTEARHPIYEELIGIYKNSHFLFPNGTLNLKTVVSYTTDLLKVKGLRNLQEIQSIQNIYIYPTDFFCPIEYSTGKLTITPNTVSIHHYSASWVSHEKKMKKFFLNKILGQKLTNLGVKYKRKLKSIIKK